MGRRKPSQVQRKRPRDADAADAARAGEASDGSSNGSDSAVHTGRDAATRSNELAPRRLSGASKRAKTATTSRFSDPILRFYERVVRDNSDHTSLQLTFRDAWTPQYRRDALWLEWRMQPQRHRQSPSASADDEETKASDSIANTLRAVLEHIATHSSSSASPHNEAIGFVLSPSTSAVAVRSAHGPTLSTPWTLAELFPDTSPAWCAHVVHLVLNELLVLEVTTRRHDATDSAEDDCFVWRVGIAWRVFQAQHQPQHLTLAPTRGASCHRSMSIVMLWLLQQVRTDTSSQQCVFPYWRELDVLYDQTVSSGTRAPGPAATNVAFDIYDVYARIQTQRQLERDTRSVDAASASGHGASLLPTLRPYQRAAVSWMLAREAPKAASSSSASAALSSLVQFPMAHRGDDSTLLAYDPYSACFVTSDDDQKLTSLASAIDTSSVRGGILADEMGLGKTVEVIALVLFHPWLAPRPTLVTTHSALDASDEDDTGNDGDDSEASMVRACICGSTDDEALGWIQCDFCKSWHHQLCVGYRSTRSTGNEDSDGDDDEPFATATPPPSSASNAFVAGMFMCFECQPVEMPTFACKTTLIVSPEAIHDQWETELRRHVKPGALSLLRYPGVKALRARLPARPSAEWQVLASGGLALAAYDIVLTTYEALSAELYHVPTEHLHARRASTRQRRKKYAFVASPLLFLRFWRVCMDEAQVGVENAQLHAALTVARLECELPWVVTGTPFSTHVRDLFGCFKFLRLAPFASDDVIGERCFRAVIESSFTRGATDRVLDLLLSDDSTGARTRDGGGLLWRTSKRDVVQQLGLPEQATEVVWCHLSDVERHFYDEQERAIVALVSEHTRQQQRGQSEDEEGAAVTDKVWHDLLVLRQICCHPQVGSTLSAMFSLRSSSSDQRLGTSGRDGGVLSMDAFLHELILKSKRTCEDAQRTYLAAQNGLAALRMITHETPAAVLTYLASMQAITRNWPLFRADLLPRLHILENLGRCVQSLFSIASDGDSGGDDGNGDIGDVLDNPKEHSVLPDLPALTHAVIATDDMSDDAIQARADVGAIARESARLDACAQRIKQFYLLQVETAHATARQAFERVANTVDERTPMTTAKPKHRVLCSRSLWWLEALAALEAYDADQVVAFADRLRARLLAIGTPWANRFCYQFTTTAGFRAVFLHELEALATKRSQLYAKLQALSIKAPTKLDVARSGNCRKCRDGRDGPVCDHCKLYRELEAFRHHVLGVDSTMSGSATEATRTNRGTRRNALSLFDNENGDDDGDGASNATATSSVLLEIFREIASSTRVAMSLQQQQRRRGTNGDDANVTVSPSDGLRDEVEFWTLVQKEWSAAKTLFQVQHQRLGALDELEMATMQLRIRLDGEVVETAAEKLYKLEAHDVPVKLASLESERVVSELELRTAMARLRFLLQMQTQRQAPSSVGPSPTAQPAMTTAATCAICLEDMENERVMLLCAHTFCKRCVQTLLKPHHASGSLRCPTCRRMCRSADIVVVSDDATITHRPPLKRPSLTTRPAPDTHIVLPRSGFGSKLDAIVRRVLALADQDPHVKCLLFTQWLDMLSIVATHLTRNGVTCFTYSTKRAFASVRQQFARFGAPCVLALPFKVGANGLNLVEATHVLLVEPLLNPSIEAQAINRVHRIGQTKPTRVHRFVVDSSVEERIYWLGQSKKTKTKASPRQSHELRASGGGGGGEDATNDGDVAESEGVDRAPTKKEKEQLTLDDLHVLLDGRTSGRAGAEDTDDGDADTSSSGPQHPFWSEHVMLNGKVQRRWDAKLFAERLHAAECRAQGRQADEEPQTQLFDATLHVAVAHEVVHLPLANALDADQAILTELLAFHQARVREELDAWHAMRA